MNIPFLLRFDGEKHHVIAVRYSNREAEKFYNRYNTPLAGFNMFISTFRGSIDRMISLYVVSLFFIALVIIFVVLGALHFLLYVFFRQNRSNLYYSIFVMAFAVLILCSLGVNSFIFGTGFVIKTRYLISLLYPFILVPLVRLLYSMFREKLPRMFWVVLALAFISTLCYVFNVSFITFIYAGFSVIVFFEIVRVTVQAIWRRIGGSWIIGVGVLVFIAFFTVISFIILFRGGLVISGIWYSLSIVMAVLSIPVSMSLFLARDFSRTNRNLKIQLEQVKLLSAKTLEQEKEKQRILEGQKERLEVMVKERTRELEEEKDKTEKLLLNTLPLKVVNDLKVNGYTEPESFDEVTVYFSDLVGFTDASSRLEPAVLIEELNRIFTAFDDIMTKHHCERIKTIGDAYLAVCGMPEKSKNHAENMAQAALEIRHYLEERNGHSEIKWKIRIGIHSGKVVGGIVGVRKYIYDVFGDTINTASRMESHSEPMRINVSETTYGIIHDYFRFTPREPMEIKGKGKMRMYFLEGGIKAV